MNRYTPLFNGILEDTYLCNIFPTVPPCNRKHPEYTSFSAEQSERGMQSVWGGVRIPSRSTRTPWACRRREVAGLPVRRLSHWLGLGSGVASIKLRFSSLMLAWCFNTSSWVLSKSLSKRQAGEDKGTTNNQHISHGERWTTLESNLTARLTHPSGRRC